MSTLWMGDVCLSNRFKLFYMCMFMKEIQKFLCKHVKVLLSFCVFQLDSYMDEQFVKAAFASAGHAVISVKIIINKITG